MMLDTSKLGWQILHSDCDDKRLDAKHAEGKSFWETFAVSDVVRLLHSHPYPYLYPRPHLYSYTLLF